MDDVRQLMELPSLLGGPREGLVFKNYSRFCADGTAMMGKWVSEAFKEVHNQEWRKANPTQGDIKQQLIDLFSSEGRWQKAIQHLREAGRLAGEPKDIGALVHEVQADFDAECKDSVKEFLWTYVKDSVHRGIVRGLPEWYKIQLAKRAWEE
jgi:hypothetical protein